MAESSDKLSNAADAAARQIEAQHAPGYVIEVNNDRPYIDGQQVWQVAAPGTAPEFVAADTAEQAAELYGQWFLGRVKGGAMPEVVEAARIPLPGHDRVLREAGGRLIR